MIEKLLLALNDCVWAYNHSQEKHVFASPNMKAVLGIAASEFTIQGLENLVIEDDRSLFLSQIEALQPEVCAELHYRIKAENGIKWIFEKRTRFIDEVSKDDIEISVIKDVTDQTAVKHHLDNALGNFSVLFDKNPHPMWIYETTSLRIIKVNNSAIEHYGYSNSDFLNMTIRDIRPKFDLAAFNEYIFRKGILKGKLHGSNTGGIWRHQNKNGDIIFAEITGHEIKYDNTSCRIIIASNVTERITFELERKKIEELANSEKSL